MSVNIYDGTNDELNQIAGREDTSYWEGTQAQWNALSSADKTVWTGKYVIITDAEESVNKYNGTELINIAGKGANGDTKDCTTTFTSSDDSTETGLILPSGGDITVPQMVSGETHGNLFSSLSKIALNTRKLINTAKRIWNSVGATWVSGHAYAVNDMVVYENGHVYKCKAAHTSSASILPTNTTYWTDTTLANEIASLNTNYANIGQITTASWNATSSNKSSYAVTNPLSLTKGKYILTATLPGSITPNTNNCIFFFSVNITNSGIPSNYYIESNGSICPINLRDDAQIVLKTGFSASTVYTDINWGRIAAIRIS